MVVICVLGIGRLGGNIAGDLAFNGHSVRVWDADKNALDKLHERLDYERKRLKDDKLITLPKFLGDVFCFSNMEEALTGADFVIEAIPENLGDKKYIFEKLSKYCGPKVILVSSTLRLPLDEIFSGVIFRERCIGIRFLYPVYCIPEVELTKCSDTSIVTVEKCLNLLERCGKTAFFRSGNEPLILNEEQREERRKNRAELFKKNRYVSSRANHSLPNLANPAGNFAPIQDDATAKKASALDAECVICMDRPRGCILAPCHHLCTCAACGDLLVNRKDACPICRRGIIQCIPFYSS